MKITPVALLGAAIVAFPALAEPKKPVSNWTCEEFLAVEGEFQPKVVYWASAHPRSGKETALVDIEGMEKVAPMVIDDCKKKPSDPFMKKLRDAWRSVESEAKKLKEKL
jgi:acid stress chaperone HdeA